MSQEEPNFSRIGRKKKRSNRLLNALIGVVVVLIVIVASSIFLRNGSEKVADNGTTDQVETDAAMNNDGTEGEQDRENENGAEAEIDETDNIGAGDHTGTKNEEMESDNAEETGNDLTHTPGTVTIVPSADEVIAETVIDASWQPIGTTQTGEHVSLYDGESVDWKEKEQALAYATGLPRDTMIFWKIKNGGGPQKSVGVVSSRDSKEKYRVYLEWIDGQGWKPVKMDVLTTLDFDY